VKIGVFKPVNPGGATQGNAALCLFYVFELIKNSQTDGLEVERHVLVKSQVSHAMLKDFLVRILWHYDGHVTNNTAIRDWDVNSVNKLCILLHFNLSSVRDCCISFHHRQPLELEELQALKVTGW
jgi:hypothetical protein